MSKGFRDRYHVIRDLRGRADEADGDDETNILVICAIQIPSII